MKLAVVDQNGCLGGIGRFNCSLLIALKKVCPELDITFFVHFHHPAQKEMVDEFVHHQIQVKPLRFSRLKNSKIRIVGSLAHRIQRQFGNRLKNFPPFLSGLCYREVEEVTKGFDLAYFPLWYYMQCPQLRCPMVSTFHDFNFRYYFSSHPIFSPSDIKLLFEETPKWLDQCVTPIVSTKAILDEIKKFYPAYAAKSKVIYIGPLNAFGELTDQEARAIVDQLKIPPNYILYPSNFNPHKNLGALLQAVSLLKPKYPDLALVITGMGTSCVNGRLCETGIEIGESSKDVFGLDYISNKQVNALIQCAKMVVSTSLYEAGNGPGLDAWAKGVPVAMSNIPAFLEHLEIHGVRAEVFNPHSPYDIADKIEAILKNPEKAKNDALHSQKALHPFTWEQIAKNYLQVFHDAV